ncbi:hypothetical protein ASE94_00385 [Devosia sp. Leaf64]|nr:hypothetical protein ASE94_00385 [Devosia sp. Leaf64]
MQTAAAIQEEIRWSSLSAGARRALAANFSYPHPFLRCIHKNKSSTVVDRRLAFRLMIIDDGNRAAAFT